MELSADMEGIHDIFHVFYLQKWLVRESNIQQLDELRVHELKHLVEEPATILERETK